MNVLSPVAITNANLIGSNIAENEYPEWAAGGFSQISTNAYNFRRMTWASSGNLYAANYTDKKIYKSTDGGVTWAIVAGAPVSSYVYAYPDAPIFGVFAHGTDIYVWCTASSGDQYRIYCDVGETGSFTDLTSCNYWVSDMCASVAGNVFAFAGSTSGKVYKQTAGTGAFSEVVDVGTLTWYSCCGCSDGSIYAVDHVGNMYRSTDECASLTDLTLTDYIFQQICADNDGNVYGVKYAGDLYKRTAGAGQFLPIGDTSRTWQSCCFDTTNGYLFAGTSNSYVFRATGTTVYAINDYVQVTTGVPSTHKIYKSLVNSNANNTPGDDATKWELIGNTNRSKVFDASITSQASQSESFNYVVAPGAIQGVSIINHESSSIEIIEIDNDSALIDITAWTGATGTTQPTGTDLVGHPSDFTIVSGALQMTVDGNGEGFSKTIVTAAATEYQVLFLYKNTAGDLAQLTVRDMTNAADILATADLPSSTEWTPYSYVFTTPAGCISTKVSLTAKTSGDIVFFDYWKCAPTIYSETITTGSTITYSSKTDLISEANCIVTVVVNNTGSTAKAGEILFGTKYDIGGRMPNTGMSWGVKNWSTIEADTYGHYDIVPRDKSKWMKCTIDVDESDTNAVSNFLTLAGDNFYMWLGSETNEAKMIYGFVDDWSFVEDEYNVAKLSLSITGIT